MRSQNLVPLKLVGPKYDISNVSTPGKNTWKGDLRDQEISQLSLAEKTVVNKTPPVLKLRNDEKFRCIPST
jgi:hypothetical protein